MKEAILVIVSDGVGGYGDFLFALKLSQQLKKYYADIGEDVPPVYIITQNTGQEKIQRLKGDIEFDITILTPDELKARIESENEALKINVGGLIEGPVFRSELLERVDHALSSLASPAPLHQISEYDHSDGMRNQTGFAKNKLKHIAYRNNMYAGLNETKGGLLLSQPPASILSSTIINQLDAPIRTALLGENDIASYQSLTDMSMQYSHDFSKKSNPALHFLNIQREFSQGRNKNQDVLMIGKNIDQKRQALLTIKDKLIHDGFSRIIFYHADSGAEECIFDAGIPGKVYRAIYTPSMSHQSIMACTVLSGKLMGTTGDQSFTEAVSNDKIIAYELFPHKFRLLTNYDKAMGQVLNNATITRKAISLLRTAKTDEEYQRLGILLRDPTVQMQLTMANKAVCQYYDLIKKIVQDDLLETHLEPENPHQLHDSTSFNANEIRLMVALDQHEQLKAIQLLQEQPSSFYRMRSKVIAKALDENCYDFIQYIIHEAHHPHQHKTLCQVFTSINPRGKTYLQQLSEAYPARTNPNTGKIYFLLMMQSLQSFQTEDLNSREIHRCYSILYKTFDEPGLAYNQEALIGLLLINRKMVVSALSQSPTVMDRHCNDLLHILAANNLSREKEKTYYQALETMIVRKLNLFYRKKDFACSLKDVNILDLLNKQHTITDKSLCYCQVMSKIADYSIAHRTSRLEDTVIRASNTLYYSFEDPQIGSTSPFTYDEQAWAGLLLLSKSKLGAAYHLVSPRNPFFGNRLYAIYDDALQSLGINSNTITPQETKKYYKALELAAKKCGEGQLYIDEMFDGFEADKEIGQLPANNF